MTLRDTILLVALAAFTLSASAQSLAGLEGLPAADGATLSGVAELVRAIDRSHPRYQSVQATFTVTTADDDGAGSLRDAITQANARPGLDAIEFAIGGGGTYQEIFLQSQLPLVTDPITIDGSTQGCDTSAGLCIRLDGEPLEVTLGSSGGLVIRGGGSTIHGLVFTRFYYDGEMRSSALALDSSGNTVTGCYFGTDRTGIVSDPDGSPESGDELGNGFGISIDTFDENVPTATDNVVGGPTAAERNVVSGSSFSGIILQGKETQRNLVVGNYIGTNATGTSALGNLSNGVFINDANLNTVRDNLISGNVTRGVSLATSEDVIDSGGPSGNLISGNYIGTNATGTAALPNGTLAGLAEFKGLGVHVVYGQDNVIEGNLISGNLLAGVVLGSVESFPDPTATFELSGTQVRGNRIGTDASGEQPIPNGVPGIQDVGFGVVFVTAPGIVATGNTIGGGTIEDANFIAFNTSAGIGAQGPGVSGNVIDGNVIGITFDEEPAPNGQVGILLRNGPRGNRIGRADPDFEDDIVGNVIGYHAIGIALGDFTVGNEIAFNRFGGAPGASLPIDLGLDGPTANDAGDPDDGPNRLQNTPTILSAFSAAGSDELTVRYLVDTATANAAYPLTVRFYAQILDGDVLVHEPLGSATYTEPGEATATIQNSLTVPLAIVATATDADGNTGEASLAGVPVADESAPTVARDVRVGPNPTAGLVRFAFDLATAADVSVMLFDALGRRVASVDGRSLNAGPHEMALDVDLAPGLYVWRLRAGDRVEAGRLTVVR